MKIDINCDVGDNGINNGSTNNQLSNSYGNMKSDDNKNNSNDIYSNNQQQQPSLQQPSLQQPQQNNDNQEVDVAIAKMQSHINKQKKINELKEEFKKTKNNNNESIIDRYIKKKKDVIKLFLLSLLVLLALSMNDVIKTYLSKYILGNDITSKNEMYLRCAVPLTIYFVIWTMKAFGK